MSNRNESDTIHYPHPIPAPTAKHETRCGHMNFTQDKPSFLVSAVREKVTCDECLRLLEKDENK